MPLVEITAPAGALPEPAADTLQTAAAEAVLTWMGLPHSAFFSGATWVYLREAPKGTAVTGDPATAPGFLVVVTALQGFLDAERNAGLSAELTRLVHTATGRPAAEAGPVWVIVKEVPEGNWAVNGALTRRAMIEQKIAQGD